MTWSPFAPKAASTAGRNRASQQCGTINRCDAQLEAAVNGVPTRDSLWSRVTCNQGPGLRANMDGDKSLLLRSWNSAAKVM